MRISRMGRLLVCLIGVAGLAGSARGILVDFSGYTLGDLADQGMTLTKWTTTPEDARILVIADSDGNLAARMQADSSHVYGGYSLSPSNSDLGLAFDPSSSVVSYGFKVRWDDRHSGYFGSDWRLYIGTGDYHQDVTIFEGAYGGAVSISYGSSADSIWLMRDDTAAVVGQWYTFSGVIDFGTKTFTVVMDGVYQGTYSFMYRGINNVNLTLLSMNANNSLFCPVSFDDVRIGSADAGLGVSLQGAVVLDGYVGDNTTAGITFEFHPVAAGGTLTRKVFLNSDGTFRLDNITPGVYDITVRGFSTLSVRRQGVTIMDNPTVLAAPVCLSASDGNGDDAVSFEDFCLLQNRYGESGAAGIDPPAGVAGYYVAPNGSDAGAGTLDSPFRTIQKAADMAQPGDTIYIRGGTYRETVTISRSGTPDASITFRPYQDEPVTVTGLDPLDDNWTQYNGPIWQHAGVAAASQVFLGGRRMIEARSTNSGYNNPFHRTYFTVDSSTYQAPPALSTITSFAMTGSWTGARVAFLGGPSYGTSSATVVSQAGNTISFVMPDIRDYARPAPGDRFYLYGSLAALDAPREWCYDAATATLYLQTPDGTAPNGRNVEIRTRLYGFDLGGQSCVTIRGLKLLAATVNISGDYNLVDNCQILYPCPPCDPQMWDRVPGVFVGGQYNTICRSEIAYSWGDGVQLENSNNTVDGCVIHDCNESGCFASCVNTGHAGNNSIQNNTIYNAGYTGILLGLNVDAPNNQILHNEVSRFGFICDDAGGIYTSNSNGAGTVIAFNRVHDFCGEPLYRGGIYVDTGTNGNMIHHNLVYNVPRGIYGRGSNTKVYNNTVWNVSDAAIVTYYVGTTTNTETINNLANNNNIQGDYLSRNRYQTADQFINSAAGDYTLKANSSGSNQGPAYKRAVDYGMIIPSITDGYTGAAPDAGAFERGVPAWTAGADWRTWTAGNQRVAPLISALYIRDDGTATATAAPLRVGRASTGDSHSYRSFLKFDLAGVSGPIAKATLRLYECKLSDNGVGSVALYPLTSAPSGGGFSYNQSVGASLTGWYDPANLDLYTEIDITDWVEGWLADPATNCGLSLRGTSEFVAGSATFWDGFYTVTAPQLLITLPTASAVSVRGTVAIQGYLGDNATVAVRFDLHPEGSIHTFTKRVFLDPDGSFRLDNIDPGVYDITVKGLATLATRLENVTISGNPTVLAAPIILIGSDANGDDHVGFEDFSILQNAYGRTGTAAADPLGLASAVGGCGAPGFLGILVLVLALRSGD